MVILRGCLCVFRKVTKDEDKWKAASDYSLKNQVDNRWWVSIRNAS